jgi:ribonuclease Z
MSIAFEVLGGLQKDNALWVRVDGGQKLQRFLFDCGQHCLDRLSFRDILDLEALFFSHLHMDHISGFDGYFRCTFQRDQRPNVLYGPPECAQVFHHRFQGFALNHYAAYNSLWQVKEIHPEHLVTFQWDIQEAFRERHTLEVTPRQGLTIYENNVLRIDALTMNHDIPSMAYIVREQPKINIDMSTARKMGLRPGPWLQWLKKPAEDGPDTLKIGETEWNMAELRSTLLVENKGDSIAYLTDFLLDEDSKERLVEALKGCKTVVCESQYAHDDLELAIKNHHMTSTQVAELARDAGIEELVVMHLSERYRNDECKQILDEIRAIFPNARFPEHWEL